MKRILISDVYHIVLDNKNMFHQQKWCIYLNIYMTYHCIIQNPFCIKKSLFLSLSYLLPISTKSMLKIIQRRNLDTGTNPATVRVIKLFFLLLQNSSMYMHSTGTKCLFLTDYSPQDSSNGQTHNKSIQSGTLREIVLVIILVISLHVQNLSYKYIFKNQYLRKTIMGTMSREPGLLHS